MKIRCHDRTFLFCTTIAILNLYPLVKRRLLRQEITGLRS